MVDVYVAIRTMRSRTLVRDIAFGDIARHILGSSYELSVILSGEKRAHTLNRTYRKKTYSPNVLSFPLSEASGEIVLNIPLALREARRYGVTPTARIAYLFVHGCIHLSGIDHGDIMTTREAQVLKKFQIDHPTE